MLAADAVTTGCAVSVVPHLLGYPRIGPDRELKWALEARWSGKTDGEAFAAPGRGASNRPPRRAAATDRRATDDFFLYDETLETAVMLGAAPDWARSDDPFEVLPWRRGTADHEAWEMTKWFDTNYHYVVPELTSTPTELTPLPWREPKSGDHLGGARAVQPGQAGQGRR